MIYIFFRLWLYGVSEWEDDNFFMSLYFTWKPMLDPSFLLVRKAITDWRNSEETDFLSGVD